MNSITNNVFRTGGLMLAVFVMFAFAVATAPQAHATDLSLGSVDFYPDQSVSFYPDQTYPSVDTSFYPDQSTSFYPDQGTSFYPDQYSYSTPTSYDWAGGGSYFTGGGFSGGGFIGGGGFGGGSTYAPTTVSTYAPTNTCTAPNTCNSTVDDHSIFNAPTTVTISGGGQQQQQQQVIYPPVYQPVYQPVVYNQPPVYAPAPIYPGPIARAPYVALSAVPYTGLDLGPVGTALYWTFLVLWCLGATYLVVVKRVQNKLVSNLNNFLFGSTALAVGGSTASNVHAAKAAAHAAPAKTHATHTAMAAQEDGIDPFIAAQIAR